MFDGGGGDLDSAAYWSSDAGVTVNLATGTGQGGEAEGDTLTGGFRRVFGSNYADHLTARNDDPDTEEEDEGSIIHAEDGDDTLQGGTGPTSVPQSQAQASASCGRARSGGEWVVKRSSRGRRSKPPPVGCSC